MYDTFIAFISKYWTVIDIAIFLSYLCTFYLIKVITKLERSANAAYKNVNMPEDWFIARNYRAIMLAICLSRVFLCITSAILTLVLGLQLVN